ncbi:hypothetical protein Bca52824_009195 [Brassica carinata]|uniref:Uncharacterized protein n=1 Tax=Brassica carinata TaxID=52824 RepID=A0A8X8B9J1_BRACI|nr:hypothetical protein Bca52824_009195 [Brassica carinata]
MKLITAKAEDSNTYQGLVNATNAGLYETPCDVLNQIPNRASARFCRQRTCKKSGGVHSHILKRSLLANARKTAAPP